jgi:hypothetical protein
MMTSPLNGLVIRTALVRRLDLGFIYACDPKKEEEETPHTIVFKWKAGVFNQVEYEYDAHTACLIEYPEFGIVSASGPGYYSVETRNGVTSGDILDESLPLPHRPRLGGIRLVAEIAGHAYAVGLRGMVYRLDDLRRWTRIDDGLPESFDIQAINGFGASNIYTVGRNGELWQFNGKEWIRHDLPTNANLTAVKCATDEKVYVGGHGGILIRGNQTTWEVIDPDGIEDDIWDLEWFDGKLYVSTMHAVYRLEDEKLELVDFGEDPPKTCYQLSMANGVMWSNGEYDIRSFDGDKWSRIV